MSLEIKTSEHVFVAGRTGSGKTYLAQKYLAGRNFPFVAVLDTKGFVSWPEVPGTRWGKGDNNHVLIDGGKNLTLIDDIIELNFLETPNVIYRPKWEQLSPEYYNEFFRWCYKRRNTTVWIDEVMSVATAGKYPEYLKAILTRGRQLHVACWALTQRPADIPVIVMSEATHVFVFDLNMVQDRERMASVTGDPTLMTKPSKATNQPPSKYDNYNFWYFNNRYSEKATLARIHEK